MIRRPPRSPLFPYTPFFRSLLLEQLGEPLIATTLIPPGETEALHDADAILERFPHELDAIVDAGRSEEHTSELQSRLHLVCRLLLEKKTKHRAKLTTQYITH